MITPSVDYFMRNKNKNDYAIRRPHQWNGKVNWYKMDYASVDYAFTGRFKNHWVMSTRSTDGIRKTGYHHFHRLTIDSCSFISEMANKMNEVSIVFVSRVLSERPFQFRFDLVFFFLHKFTEWFYGRRHACESHWMGSWRSAWYCCILCMIHSTPTKQS